MAGYTYNLQTFNEALAQLPPLYPTSMRYMDMLKQASAELHDSLLTKLKDNDVDPEDIQNGPNQMWQELWERGLDKEYPISKIFRMLREGPSRDDPLEQNFKVKAFAEALINTPFEAWSAGGEKQGIIKTLLNEHLDIWPYIINTVPRSGPYEEEIVPNRFALMKTKGSVLSNFENYGFNVNPQTRSSAQVATILDTIDTFAERLANNPNYFPNNLNFDTFLEVHKMLYSHLYEWAGEPRKANMCKYFIDATGKYPGWGFRCFNSDSPNYDWRRVANELCQTGGLHFTQFTNYESIREQAEEVFRQLRVQLFTKDGSPIIQTLHHETGEPYSDEEKCAAFARIIAKPYLAINQIHPTREGTSNVNQLFFKILAMSQGLDLDWSVVTKSSRKVYAILEAKNSYSAMASHECIADPEEMLKAMKSPADVRNILSSSAKAEAYEKMLLSGISIDRFNPLFIETHLPDIIKAGGTKQYYAEHFTDERNELIQSLINRLFQGKVPSDDPELLIVTGCPGSGKSELKPLIADNDLTKAVQIDGADFCQSMPEYQYLNRRGDKGALGVVGSEVYTKAVFPSLERALVSHYDTYAELMTRTDMRRVVEQAKVNGYKNIKLVIVTADIEECQKRISVTRGSASNQAQENLLVPLEHLSVFLDKSVDDLKAALDSGLEVIVISNTTVPRVIAYAGRNSRLNVFDQQSFEDYVSHKPEIIFDFNKSAIGDVPDIKPLAERLEKYADSSPNAVRVGR